MSKKAENLTLALCIALLPPLWAVAAPYLGVTADLCRPLRGKRG